MSSTVGQVRNIMNKPLILSLFAGVSGHRRARKPELPQVSPPDCLFVQLLPRADRQGGSSGFSVRVDPWDGQHHAVSERPSELASRGLF